MDLIENLLNIFNKRPGQPGQSGSPAAQGGKNSRQNLLMVLSILAMVGIFLMLLNNKLQTPRSSTTPPVQENSPQASEPTFSDNSAKEGWEERTERRLEEVLSLIQGVGRIEVDITLEQGAEYIYGQNTNNTNNQTEEKDTAGGTRSVHDSSNSNNIVIFRDKDGREQPLIQTEKSPTIKGVIVVAEGADQPRINADLSRAVNTVLGVPLHKICVLTYKR